MTTAEDTTLQDFDLDLLLDSAPSTSTENASIQEAVYVNQNLNLPERTEQVSVQCQCSCRRLYEESKKDYDQIKRQYMKLGQDYADVHYESKKHALDAMQFSSNNEKLTEEMKIIRQENISKDTLNSVTTTLYQAELCNNRQLVNLAEQHVNEIAHLKNRIESYILGNKTTNRDMSSLKRKLKIYEEDLFTFAVLLNRLIDKKNRDRETHRKITKYTNKKYSADLENTDIESVDTGRGSSLSTYSPAYSIINFSPLTENFEQKIMQDASTSTLQTKETENFEQKNMKDASTSTLQTKETEHFEQKNMKDASTSTLQTKETKYFEQKNMKDASTTTLQTKETEHFEQKNMKDASISTLQTKETEHFKQKNMKDASTSTLQTKETEYFEQKNMKDASTSTLQTKETKHFEQKNMKDASTTTLQTKETEHFKQKNMKDASTSTQQTNETFHLSDHMEQKITTVDTASSPICFVDNSLQDMSNEKFTDIVSRFSGIRCPAAKAKINDLEFTPKSTDMANSPIYVANPSSPAAMSPSWESTTSPIELKSLKFSDVTIPGNKITDISRSLEPTAVPFKPAPSSVVETPEMTRPLQSADVLERSTDKTPMPEMANPIETTDFVNQEGKTTRSKHMISLINNTVSVITKTPDFNPLINAAYVRRSVIQTPLRPMKHADTRRPLITTKQLNETKQNENINIFSSEKSLHENLNGIQSHIAQDNNLERDDVEVGMILNKFRLDFNALSPMSVTPDLDEEGLVQSKSDVRNDETEEQTLEHSRSQISIEDSLLVTPNYMKLTVPQNKSNNRKHKINEDNPSHLNKNKVLKPVSIPPVIPTHVHNENKLQSDQTMRLRNRKASVEIFDKNTKSNEIEIPQTLSELASNVSSLESQSDLQYESNSFSHISRNQLTESQESIKKEYLLKGNQIDSIVSKPPKGQRSERIKYPSLAAQSKTESVPQSQTKVKSSPIDNMLISNEPQLNTRKPPERQKLERIKSANPAEQSKTMSVPQTKLQSSPKDNMSVSKESQSNTRKQPEKRRSERKTPKKKSVPQTPTTLQSSPIDNMSVSKESQSNICQPPERRRSERINSAIIKAQFKTSCVPQNLKNIQSSPIDNMSVSKESQTNTCQPPERRRSERIKSTTSPVKTNNILQNQTSTQSSPIDNMSISKKSQTNTCHPPERRRSERIKPTSSSVKTNSITQNQMKLESRLIDNKEPHSNTRTGCSPILSNPEYGRKRTISRSINAQPDNIHSKVQRKSECDTNKQISRVEASSSTNFKSVPKNNQSENISERKATETIIKDLSYTAALKRIKLVDDTTASETINKDLSCTPVSKRVNLADEAQSDNKHSESKKNSECDTNKLNSAELCIEDKFMYSYSTPYKQRISRVKGSVSSNTKSVPNNNQSENISERKATETIIKDLSNIGASKRTTLADDATGFFIKSGQNKNKNDYTKMSITHASPSTKNMNPKANLKSKTTAFTTWTKYENNHLMALSETEQSQNSHGRHCADYNDIDIFNTHNILNTDQILNTNNNNLKTHKNKMDQKRTCDWTHNLLDKMIFKYGSQRKYMNKSSTMEIYEDQIAREIHDAVSTCVNVSAYPNKYYETLQKAVGELQRHSNISWITGGFTKYITSSDRKAEFVPGNKDRNDGLKAMPTKYVVALMQILDCADKNGLRIWEPVLNTCKYVLFNLDKNAVPRMDVVETVTHLFVNMCRYEGRKNSKSIVLFMLAAMYCSKYKAVIMIQQCLDLVPEILPYEHEMEKTLCGMKPLLRVVIYLLHIFACEDKYGKAKNLRFTLKTRYGYNACLDNDTTILHILKEEIKKIRDHYLEIEMLEKSILILAKRKGPMWCHTNIVQKILLPILKGQIYASKAAFRFCIAIIIKLLKPYNDTMSVATQEVVNLLMRLIEQPHLEELKEDIICSLMRLNLKSVKDRINIFLANWNPPSVSPMLEKALEKYIQRMSLKSWNDVYNDLVTH